MQIVENKNFKAGYRFPTGGVLFISKPASRKARFGEIPKPTV